MFAALSPDRRFITLAVVNATDSEQKVDLTVDGARLRGKADVWRMTGKDLEAANHVGQPPQVEVKETSLGEMPATLRVSPISVEIYRFAAKQ